MCVNGTPVYRKWETVLRLVQFMDTYALLVIKQGLRKKGGFEGQIQESVR